MESVTAGQELDRLSGSVEGFQANRTVIQGGIEGTSMGVQSCRFHANPALVAVRVLVRSADPTDPALVAVVLTLMIAIGKRNFVVQ